MVGQDEIVAVLKELAKKDHPPPMLFSGPSGVGKTTAAHCFAAEIKWPIIEINASDDRGINVIREDVKNNARLAYKKVIYLSEADYLTSDAQPALRRTMEKYGESTVFILSVNYLHRIIEPIQSRCAKFVFNKLDKRTIITQLVKICKTENVPYNAAEAKKALVQIAEMTNGDLRKAINILDAVISSSGTITEAEVLMQQKPLFAKEALDLALSGDFDNARVKIEECYAQTGYSTDEICSELYKALKEIPQTGRRLRLYDRLADIEYHCKIGCDAIIQLVSFMAYIAASGAMQE